MNPDLRSQEAFYDQRWANFQYANGHKLARAVAILNAITRLGLRSPSILDLGCGIGWLTGILSQFGPTLGVELSSLAVKEAKKRYPTAQFVQADILNWKYPQGTFDLVVSQEVLEHLDDQPKYLNIAADLLKQNGWLILTMPNRRILEFMTPDTRAMLCNQPIENWLTRGELSRLLNERFSLVHMTTLVPGFGSRGIHRVVNSTRLISLLAASGLQSTYDVLRLWMGFGLHILAVAKKKR